MRVHFDEEADAVYLRLDDSEVIESEEVQPGIVLDFDRNEQVIGIEILRTDTRLPPIATPDRPHPRLPR